MRSNSLSCSSMVVSFEPSSGAQAPTMLGDSMGISMQGNMHGPGPMQGQMPGMLPSTIPGQAPPMGSQPQIVSCPLVT